MPPKKKTATKGKELVLPAQEEKEAKKKSLKQKERRKNPTRQPNKLETKTKKKATKKENETKKMKHNSRDRNLVLLFTGRVNVSFFHQKRKLGLNVSHCLQVW